MLCQLSRSMKKIMTNHGGKRPGSGRKNEGKVQVCYKLAPDVVRFLREHERPASRLIEDAVRAHFLLKTSCGV